MNETREEDYRGYGIFVGVDEVDPTHYARPYNLDKAKSNAKGYLDFAQQSRKFEQLDYFCGAQATWANLKALLLKYAELSYLQEGFLFISITCHGEYLKRFGDDDCYADMWQMLCYYDQMISEEEIRRILSVFHKNFTVVFVTDACFSGGLLRQKSIELTESDSTDQSITGIRDTLSQIKSNLLSMPSEETKMDFEKLESMVSQADLNRQLCDLEGVEIKCKDLEQKVAEYKAAIELRENNTYLKNKGFYDKMLNSYSEDPDFQFDASICFMGSGREFGASKVGKDKYLLHYSALLLAMLNSGTFKGNYFELNKILTRKIDRKYQPYFFASHDKKKDRFNRFRPCVLYGRAFDTPDKELHDWKIEIQSTKGDLNFYIKVKPKWIEYQTTGMRWLTKVEDIEKEMIVKYLHYRAIKKGYVLVIGMKMANGVHDFPKPGSDCSYLKCYSKGGQEKCIPWMNFEVPELSVSYPSKPFSGKPNAHVVFFDSDYHRVLGHKQIPFQVDEV